MNAVHHVAVTDDVERSPHRARDVLSDPRCDVRVARREDALTGGAARRYRSSTRRAAAAAARSVLIQLTAA